MVLKCRNVWQSGVFHPFTSPSEADFTLTTAKRKYRNHTCLWYTRSNFAPFFLFGISLRFTCNKLENSICQKDVLCIRTSGQQQRFVVSRPRGRCRAPVFACVFAFALPLVTSSGLAAAGRSLGFSCNPPTPPPRAANLTLMNLQIKLNKTSPRHIVSSNGLLPLPKLPGWRKRELNGQRYQSADPIGPTPAKRRWALAQPVVV